MAIRGYMGQYDLSTEGKEGGKRGEEGVWRREDGQERGRERGGERMEEKREGERVEGRKGRGRLRGLRESVKEG